MVHDSGHVMFELDALQHPIVQAPMSGGPSTPALAAAVSGAGGLGFLAAGYKSPDAVDSEIEQLRSLTGAPFGVNIFLLAESEVDDDAVADYARALESEARHRGVPVGEPRFDDDALAAKLELVCEQRVPVVSFTFGCPDSELVARLHEHGTAVWVTVTEVAEGLQAAAAGADALAVQGVEAGGHRGSFEDLDGHGELSLLVALRLLARECRLPLIGSGGIADGAGVAAALAAGARAVQIGTAFMRCPEAGTSDAHRDALARPGATALTRAFTGRRARGIVNAFMREHDHHAPAAYPHIHHLTTPLRAAARSDGDADGFHLWAGEAHELARERPAAELVRSWSDDAERALKLAGSRLRGGPT
jgi:nitronate monooxygenase